MLSKLDDSSIPLTFVGYSDTQKGYLLLDPCINKVTCSESVLFNENITGSGEPFNSFEWKVEEDLSVLSLLENPDCTSESSVLIENKL
jgi:hypothetical protein